MILTYTLSEIRADGVADPGLHISQFLLHIFLFISTINCSLVMTGDSLVLFSIILERVQTASHQLNINIANIALE